MAAIFSWLYFFTDLLSLDSTELHFIILHFANGLVMWLTLLFFVSRLRAMRGQEHHAHRVAVFIYVSIAVFCTDIPYIC